MIQPTNKHELIYLACPYTHPSAAIRLQRFQEATKAAAALIKQGRIVFSPITMTHPIDIEMAGSDNTLGSDFWVAFDEAFLERCDVFVLLPLDGWGQSRGIRREIEYFQKAGKPLMALDDQFRLTSFEGFPLRERIGIRSRQALG
jgi:hypothetical protein